MTTAVIDRFGDGLVPRRHAEPEVHEVLRAPAPSPRKEDLDPAMPVRPLQTGLLPRSRRAPFDGAVWWGVCCRSGDQSSRTARVLGMCPRPHTL